MNSTTIPFNSDNQLSASGYSFDGNGNPTTYGGTSLSFDPENRMTAFGSVSSATYRADGLRASKTTSSGTTYFLYDGAEPIIETNSSGTVTATNVFAPDGLVARTTSSGTTEYVFDQQGNVADRTNTSGGIQSITQYDAWGNEQVVSGTVTDPFGYNAQSGYYLDRETGLYLCQHRFYDPGNGRWINRDPIGFEGGTNLYGYCADESLGSADSSGFNVGYFMKGKAAMSYNFWLEWWLWSKGRGEMPPWVSNTSHKFGEEKSDPEPTTEFPKIQEFYRDLLIDGAFEGAAGMADMDTLGTAGGIGLTFVSGTDVTMNGVKTVGGYALRIPDACKANDNAVDGHPEESSTTGQDCSPWERHPGGRKGE